MGINKDDITVGGTWDEGEKSYGKTIKEFEITQEEVRSQSNIKEEKVVEPQVNDKLSKIDYAITKDETIFKKTFNIRESFVTMLNQLKVVHPNPNTRFNIIVEKAIKHYYKYIMEEGGSQEE
ncbi:hypothetical protein D3C76_1299640 [compost metagenome]